ncbi:MAG: pseudouridine synthase [Leptolyngbyaceae cyanobacterium bins.349]|nr:pseudouridine synthase [Leptolyngbyaceae cyanobacterium bins.349]
MVETGMAEAIAYWYEGRSPQTDEWLRLPRTPQAEAIARELMQVLAQDDQYNREGKMYGVLLVATPTGEPQVLKAFSGLLNGQSRVDGWVPSIPGRDSIALEEALTLSRLDAIKQEILALQHLPERSHLANLTQQFTEAVHQLTTHHHLRKNSRQQQRQTLHATLTGPTLAAALDQLNRQSQHDKSERRRLKQQYREQLQPLQQLIDQADCRIHTLKQQRKQLSRQLQTQMYQAYRLTNFAGTSLSLQQLMGNGGLPTGTGDCCAPKLLHYAAVHGLKPLALAEFWWGPPSAQHDKIAGEFYGTCRDRCQPLMGFLLSGLAVDAGSQVEAAPDLPPDTPLLYADDWLIAVDKPAGLLSVPGRSRDRQDSVLNRWRATHPDMRVVHRLDQDTSGILLLARDRHTYQHLSQQFQARQVRKVYEAVLAGAIAAEAGTIDLPLWGDPEQRPRQQVNWAQGKPSTTKFRVLAQANGLARIEFLPITGRTHQLRVHALAGLGSPILGDRLYGDLTPANRLHLHARELIVQHPHTGQSLHLQSTVPF